MSSKKPFFRDLRSAVISIAVVAVLLILGILAIDQNNIHRLKGYQTRIQELRATVDAQLFQRFSTLEALLLLIDEVDVTAELNATVSQFKNTDEVDEISLLYIKMDRQLTNLQRQLFGRPSYTTYAPYFELMYQIEQQLSISIAAYNDQIAFFNSQQSAFPASLAAKRLDMEKLPRFSMGTALEGRP